MSDSPPGVRLTESARVETFSDAVMAIVLTLLVLELRVPPHDPGRLPAALAQMWAPIVAFLISFLRVSVVWLNHHDLFSRIRRVDRPLLCMNLWLLLNCTIIPVPTAILADALRAGNMAELRVATIVYILLAMLLVSAWLPIFPYLRDHPELVGPGTDAAFLHVQRIRSQIGVGVDVIAVVVAMVAPVLALAAWTLSLVFLALTSEGIRANPLSTRRRAHALKEERTP
jgi:uncharacterized membrane protein